jgi:hypothetical protein
MNAYQDVPIGASSKEVVALIGEPYAVHQKSDGTVEYEYIERITAGARNMETRHYFIVLKDGQVISKRIKQSSPPAYTFDSFDMQTTQNRGNSGETE